MFFENRKLIALDSFEYLKLDVMLASDLNLDAFSLS